LFVPVLLFLVSLFSDLFRYIGRNRIRAISTVLGIIVIASFAYSIANLYPNLTKRGDWTRVSAFIQQHESPGQPIVVFGPFDALALPYHYSGVNRVLPDENHFDLELQAPAGTSLSLARQNTFVISKIPKDAQKIWLVVNEKCMATEACRPLENYVQANYTVELEKEFYLGKVYLLRAKTL